MSDDWNAFHEGKRAKLDGQPLTDNPYEESSEARQQWANGWYSVSQRPSETSEETMKWAFVNFLRALATCVEEDLKNGKPPV